MMLSRPPVSKNTASEGQQCSGQQALVRSLKYHRSSARAPEATKGLRQRGRMLQGNGAARQTKIDKVAENVHHGKPTSAAGSQNGKPGRHERCSSQMHSSHHCGGRRETVLGEAGRRGRRRKGGSCDLLCNAAYRTHPTDQESRVAYLPPSSGAQSPGVHLAHISHANKADNEVIHPRPSPSLCHGCCPNGESGKLVQLQSDLKSSGLLPRETEFSDH